MSLAILDARGLEAWYGPVRALHGLDFEVDDGGVTAVLGANGAGKTTILRALSGLIRRTGDIRFRGRPIGALATEDVARLGIAHVPDGRGTFFDLTVEENLRLGALLQSGGRRGAALADAYQRFPMLAERRRRAAGTLSGGERQILVIARALMAAPFGKAREEAEHAIEILADALPVGAHIGAQAQILLDGEIDKRAATVRHVRDP